MLLSHKGHARACLKCGPDGTARIARTTILKHGPDGPDGPDGRDELSPRTRLHVEV